MTVSLWQWTLNVVTTCWKHFSYLTWDSQLEYGESVVSAGRCHSPYGTTLGEHPTCYIPRAISLRLVTFSGPPIHWTLLHLTFFLWGYLEAQVFTHNLPESNSIKNAIRQEIANVTQGNLHRVMSSVPGRWQQCLDCHGGHLQDVVLKTWGFYVNPRHWLTWPCSVVFIAVYNKWVILLSKWVTLNAAPCICTLLPLCLFSLYSSWLLFCRISCSSSPIKYVSPKIMCQYWSSFTHVTP
jgi:hypothetical protein